MNTPRVRAVRSGVTARCLAVLLQLLVIAGAHAGEPTIIATVPPGTWFDISTGWGNPGYAQGMTQYPAGDSSVTVSGGGSASWRAHTAGSAQAGPSSFFFNGAYQPYTPERFESAMVTRVTFPSPGDYIITAVFNPETFKTMNQHDPAYVSGSLGLYVKASYLPGGGQVQGLFQGAHMGGCTFTYLVRVNGMADVLPQLDGLSNASTCPFPARSGGSIIDNTRAAHIHDATDYASPRLDGTTGCSPCGSTPDGDGLPRVGIVRIHRYHDLDRQGAFGPGVFLSTDVRLSVDTISGRVEFFDPRHDVPVMLARSAAAVWTPVDRAMPIADLRFRTAADVETDDPAVAARAILTAADGATTTFDIFPADPTTTSDLLGRPRVLADRHGNALTIRYVQADARQAATGTDPSSAWRLLDITDTHGLTIGFTTARAHGCWVVTEAACPNGTVIRYHYDSTIVGPSRIEHADGSRSTFATAYVPSADQQEIQYADAAATAEHRTKRARVTNGMYAGSATSGGRVQAWNRIRALYDATGARVYANTVTPASGPAWDPMPTTHRITVVDGVVGQAGVAYRRLDVARGWLVREQARTTTGSGTAYTDLRRRQPQAGTLWVGAIRAASGLTTTSQRDAASGVELSQSRSAPGVGLQLRATRQINARAQPIVWTDAIGRTTTYTYDASGRRLQSMTEAHGTAVAGTTAYDYNARGQVIATTDAAGRVVNRVYDARGFLQAVQQPADILNGPRSTTTWEYDTAGRVSASIDPVGNRTTYAYDARNRIIGITYQDGGTEVFRYGTGTTDANLLLEHQRRNGSLLRYAHDVRGRVIGEYLIDPSTGRTITTLVRTYLPGCDLVASEHRDGDRTTYTYDEQRRVASMTRHPRDGVALTETYRYDADGRLVQTTDAYGRRTYAVYDPFGRHVRDLRELVVAGLPAHIDPAAAPRVGGVNPPYAVIDHVYNDADERIATIDATGVRSEFVYDARGRLSSATVAAGTPEAATTVYTYDAVGNRTQVTSPRGVITAYAYSPRNQVVTVTEAVGTAEQTVARRMTYTLTGRLATTTDARAFVSTFAYEACCDRLTGETDPLGFIVSYGYDTAGRRQSMTDQRNRTTQMQYDLRDRLVRRTDPLGRVTQVVYDDNLADGVGIELVPAVSRHLADLGLTGASATGSAVATINPAGETAYEVHDGLDRIVLRVDPRGHATRVVHDGLDGDLVEQRTVDAAGGVLRMAVDGLGAVRRIRDQLGAVSTIGYDANGREVTRRDPQGVGSDQTWDRRGRLATRTETRRPDGVMSWTYDADGNLIRTRDALGQDEIQAWDLRNRRVTLTDRLGATTAFTYDAAGQLATISDAENEARRGSVSPQVYAAGMTAYRYDARGLLDAEVYPTGQAGRTLRTYTYDPARRLVSRAEGAAHATVAWTFAAPAAAVSTAFDYDDVHRLTTRTTADDVAAFTYNPAGRLITASTSRDRITVALEHDAAGQVTRETMTIADGRVVGQAVVPATFVVDIAYDALGRQQQVTVPTGEQIRQAYDARGALVAVDWRGEPVVRRRYDAGGRLVETVHGSGVREQRTYAPGDARVATIDAGPVQRLGYTYDIVGRKTAEDDLATPTRSQRFGYDAASRLTSWQVGPEAGPPVSTQSWVLSTVGDWSSTTRDGVPQVRTHTAVHEATQVGAAPLTYDIQGNLLQDPDGQQFRWDAQQRLLEVRQASGNTSGVARYRYDALGRRVTATSDGWRTVFIHAAARVVQEQRMLEPTLPGGETGDGTAADLARTPAGLDRQSGAFLPGATWTPTTPGVIRLDMQPGTAARQDGYLADRGAVFGARTSGLSYGWSVDRTGMARVRGSAALPAWDTLVLMEGASFEVALPAGTYPVIVVAGDPAFTDHTNHLLIEGQAVTDPDPGSAGTGYAAGDFDGYAVLATVADGRLTIAAGAGAVQPRLCLVEIGPSGATISQPVRDRLADVVQRMSTATAAMPGPRDVTTTFIHGSYIDEVVGWVKASAVAVTRYGVHSNHLYSASAMTDSTGAVVERYRYDAYGTRTVMTAGGTTLPASTIGFQRGFTGYNTDDETGLYYARSRQYDPKLGKFLSRNPWHPNLMGVTPPVYWPNKVKGHGVGSYIQSRMGMYDFAFNSPSNFVEPFSEAGEGGDQAIPIPAEWIRPPPRPYSPSKQYSSSWTPPAHYGEERYLPSGGPFQPFSLYVRADVGSPYHRLWQSYAVASVDVAQRVAEEAVLAATAEFGTRFMLLAWRVERAVECPTMMVNPGLLKPLQPMFEYDLAKLRSLNAEIAANGLKNIPPVNVYKLPDGRLFIEDGHHRVWAANANGILNIPAYVTEVRDPALIDKIIDDYIASFSPK